MPEFVLSCCSTADMPRSFFEERDVQFLCFHFTMDGVDYPDDLGETMPFDDFYARISAGATPTTSQVPVGQYMAHFESFLKDGKDVLHLTLSSGITGSYGSACVARDHLLEKYPDRKLVVIDSLAASSGFGLLATLACDVRDEGKSIEETAAWIEENKLNVHHWFFSSDLTSYYRGGRISAASALFGTVLHICPLINVDFMGRLIPRTKHRGKKRATMEAAARMEEFAKDRLDYSGRCYISHAGCFEDARQLADIVEEKFKKLNGKVMINSIGSVIGAHTGPGTVALFFVGDKRED